MRDAECKLFIKTASVACDAAIALIKKEHPYTVPEITTIGGNGSVAMYDDYWAWLTAYVRSAGA